MYVRVFVCVRVCVCVCVYCLHLKQDQGQRQWHRLRNNEKPTAMYNRKSRTLSEDNTTTQREGKAATSSFTLTKKNEIRTDKRHS